MKTIKLRIKGKKQIVVLPENYHFNSNEVSLKKVGESIIISPINNHYESLINSLDLLKMILWKKEKI